jgi:hypothetical protein
MQVLKYLDTPISWAVVGFAIGLGLGVNTISVWLVVAGLGAFLIYLWRHGPARSRTEGMLFASGPVFLVSWIAGFIIHGLVF